MMKSPVPACFARLTEAAAEQDRGAGHQRAAGDGAAVANWAFGRVMPRDAKTRGRLFEPGLVARAGAGRARELRR
ncbi:hypothetical protein JN27_08450 [Massilia sp. BSC265]|nr:hypothetical protein JN27_08450 [Massilia sp. BSC265]